MKSTLIPILVLLLCCARTSQAQFVNSSERVPIRKDQEAFDADIKARLAKASDLRKQAIALANNKEYAKAVPLFQQAIETFPPEPDCSARLAYIYEKWKQPQNIVNVLRPILYPVGFNSSTQNDQRVQMLYVLALLDTGKWEEAATFYEKKVTTPPRWGVPCYGVGAGGKDHNVPNVHFDPDIVNVPGLRAQAHLILGTRAPYDWDYSSVNAIYTYELDHLQQALQSDRRCVDAQFLIGVIQSELLHFDEAKIAFDKTLKLVPREAKPEIEAAIKKMKEREANYKPAITTPTKQPDKITTQ